MWKQAPDCLNQNLHFNKLPVIVCILKFKNHHSKIYVYLISILLYKKNQLITAYSQYSYMGLEKGMATHSNILAWRIQMDRGAWRATVHGVTKSDTERLSNWHTHMPGTYHLLVISISRSLKYRISFPYNFPIHLSIKNKCYDGCNKVLHLEPSSISFI